MSITNGPNLGLMVNGLQGEAHYSQFMAFLRGMDGFGMPRVLGYLTNTPPGSPADGDCYIIGAAPTGVWAGQGGKFTRYSSVAVAWEFFTAKNGWMVQASSAREIYRYTASAWEIFYQEGTWTPVPTSLTVVGTPSYSGNYTKVGNTVHMWMLVSSTTSTASTVGVTTFTLPFSSATTAVVYVVNANGIVDIGPGLITSGVVFMPGWAASAGPMTFNGTYRI